MSKRKKGIKASAGITILVLVLLICIGTATAFVLFTKTNLAKQEAKLPESAISLYLKQIKNNDFNGIYENSLLIDPHLNSKEDYDQAIKNIYDGVSLDKLIYQEEKSASDDLLYGLYDGNVKVAVIKLVKGTDGKWLASTVFQGDHSSIVEAPAGVIFKVNGVEVTNDYISNKNVTATNFSGLDDQSDAPKVVRYELNNLISEPVITTDNSGYTTIKDALSNTYFIGKETTDSDLEETIINAGKTVARYPTKDGTLGAIGAITITGSDFYDRIKTMDNQWYAAHGTSQFSNEEVLSIVQQDENSMIANVIFDYYIASGSTSKEYHIGYQISFLNVRGTWKIAGFAIDNEMNPKTKIW
ncbi:hypothetical protein [Anaerorhabdus furcosa]|uniref:NTF2-like N-terminal transpeptidase domain-containing protein n=1 Tax=Anaerorhabdus furcosa TaxID=118967 RepID=A0A1T4PX26_9FIRM|nr:hypothetical protein [Anaerorhabdus furcosa]SJZ96039.1 hypothetical protein SAMN02745191_2224 [Anaerorhabdus furcosa]